MNSTKGRILIFTVIYNNPTRRAGDPRISPYPESGPRPQPMLKYYTISTRMFNTGTRLSNAASTYFFLRR